MKKFTKAAIAVLTAVTAFGAVSCGTTDSVSSNVSEEASRLIEYQNINWDGQEFGEPVPQWPNTYRKLGFDGLTDMQKESCQGKLVYLVSESNSDQKLARESARNQIAFQIATELNQAAMTSFSQVIDDQEKAQETIQAAAAKAKFTGFKRVDETWVRRLEIDHTKGDKKKDLYTYYCLYSVDKDVFEELAKKYLNDIIAKTVKSENFQKAQKMAEELVADFSANGFDQSDEE